MADKIVPLECPQCRHPNIILRFGGYKLPHRWFYMCCHCAYCGPSGDTQAAALCHWNNLPRQTGVDWSDIERLERRIVQLLQERDEYDIRRKEAMQIAEDRRLMLQRLRQEIATLKESIGREEK